MKAFLTPLSLLIQALHLIRTPLKHIIDMLQDKTHHRHATRNEIIFFVEYFLDYRG